SGILEMYTAGLTTAEENLQVQQYVLQYPEVAAELAAIEAGIESYATGMQLQPDPSVRQKVLARISEGSSNAKVIPLTSSRTTAKVIPVAFNWKRIAAAAILLLICSSVFNFIQFKTNDTISKELQQSQELAKNLDQKNSEMSNYLEMVQSRFSTPVSLTSMPS